MPQVHSEMESAARIRVVGIGGSGKNAINHMVNARVRGVDFMVINTDAQDLQQSGARMKIHIGKNLTRGLGAGMNPAVGKRAAEETQSEIQDALRGSDMVFIAGGMGGGTCTGAAPIVAKIAKDSGALTVAVVTKPFSFEGQQRMRLAEQGLEELRKEVDALIVIPNDRLLAVVEQNTTVKSAFAMCDEILRQAVEGVSDLITTPLLDISINGAKGVLLSIAGGEDLGLLEVQAAASIVTESIDKNAKVIFGTSRDDRLKKGDVRVTVIATGFPEEPGTGGGRPLFQMSGKKEKKDDEGKGHTVVPTHDEADEDVVLSAKKREEPSPKPRREEEDDEWGVPAFLSG